MLRRLPIPPTTWRFEDHLIVWLHQHLARFDHRLAVDEKLSGRARRSAAEAFRRQTGTARHRVEQPRAVGAHVPRDGLSVTTAWHMRTNSRSAEHTSELQ